MTFGKSLLCDALSLSACILFDEFINYTKRQVTAWERAKGQPDHGFGRQVTIGLTPSDGRLAGTVEGACSLTRRRTRRS